MRPSGFTLVEVVLVAALFTVVAAIISLAFTNFFSHSAIEGAAQSSAALLEKAREYTLLRKGGEIYGVYFATGSIALFPGGSYESGEFGSEIYSLPPGVTVGNYTLGGGAAVVFDPVTGETKNAGTVLLLGSSAEETATITIHATGAIERE